MSIHEFRSKLELIKRYVSKLKKQSISLTAQKILLIYYAKNLNINLSNRMAEELLSL